MGSRLVVPSQRVVGPPSKIEAQTGGGRTSKGRLSEAARDEKDVKPCWVVVPAQVRQVSFASLVLLSETDTSDESRCVLNLEKQLYVSLI